MSNVESGTIVTEGVTVSRERHKEIGTNTDFFLVAQSHMQGNKPAAGITSLLSLSSHPLLFSFSLPSLPSLPSPPLLPSSPLVLSSPPPLLPSSPPPLLPSSPPPLLPSSPPPLLSSSPPPLLPSSPPPLLLPSSVPPPSSQEVLMIP